MKTLSVIGCGRVGKTLGRLWNGSGSFRIESILNRSIESSRHAVEFIGAGRAVARFGELDESDVFLIATPDDSIEESCTRLCNSGRIMKGAVVFHCSGSLPSTVLEPAKDAGALVASVHPVKSVADPGASANTFSGTHCAIEGDEGACRTLSTALEKCGAHVFPIETDSKEIYHAGTVFACNYLVALLEVGFRCLEKAGLRRDDAAAVLEPIVRETISNVFSLGPANALTGPVARGDKDLVGIQMHKLQEWSGDMANLYAKLGQVAVDLASERNVVPCDSLNEIREILSAEEKS